MLKCIAVLIALFLPILSLAQEINWAQTSLIKVDVNCDGIKDTAIIGYVDSDVIVKVNLAGESKHHSLKFGLADAARQDALCGNQADLTAHESNASNLMEIFDELPEGYKVGKGCFDLNLKGGECDSINIFWNHKTNTLNWWRL